MNRRGSIVLYRRLLRHVRPYWRPFALAVLAMLLAAAAQPAIPMILKPVLDESFIERDPSVVASLTVLLVLAFVVWGFANWARTVAFSIVSQRVLFDLRRLMFDKLVALPIGRPDRHSVPRLMSKLTFDADRIAQAADRSLAVLVTDVLAVIGLLAWMAWIDWQLTLLMLGAAPLVALTVRHFNRRLRRVSRRVQDAMGQTNHLLRETLDGEKAVRVFAGQEYERRRFSEAANRVRLCNFKLTVGGAYPGAIVQIVVAVSIGVIITVTAYRAAAGAVVVNWAKTVFSETLPEMWLYLFGALFIGVVLLFPRGLAGIVGQIRELPWVRSLLARSSRGAQPAAPAAAAGTAKRASRC